MFRLPFGRKEFEQIAFRERNLLLSEGKKELNSALLKSSSEPVTVSPKAFGYLLNEGAWEQHNFKKKGGYLHQCVYQGKTYQCITPTKV